MSDMGKSRRASAGARGGEERFGLDLGGSDRCERKRRGGGGLVGWRRRGEQVGVLGLLVGSNKIRGGGAVLRPATSPRRCLQRGAAARTPTGAPPRGGRRRRASGACGSCLPVRGW